MGTEKKPTATPGPWEDDETMISGPKRYVERLYLMQNPVRDAAPELLYAIKLQVSWIMRDGTPCVCPAGRDEDYPKGEMPTVHSTACEYLRAAISKAESQEAR